MPVISYINLNLFSAHHRRVSLCQTDMFVGLQVELVRAIPLLVAGAEQQRHEDEPRHVVVHYSFLPQDCDMQNK